MLEIEGVIVPVPCVDQDPKIASIVVAVTDAATLAQVVSSNPTLTLGEPVNTFTTTSNVSPEQTGPTYGCS